MRIPLLGAEANYLLFPLNRQHRCKHWMLATLDLRTKQFTLLGSYARNDKRPILGKAEVARLQEYLDHLAVREHNKPIEWPEPRSSIPCTTRVRNYQALIVDCSVHSTQWP